MPLDPLRIACFRFELISPALDGQLTAAQRRRYLRATARNTISWPSERCAHVSERTLARWLAAYRKDPRIESLLPKPPPPKEPGRTLSPEVLQYALALLEQEPQRSLYVLIKHVTLKFELAQPPTRATLHRALKAQPRYLALRKRARGETRIRRRFQAERPHQIWQADAKAAFTVSFADGTRWMVRILSLLDDATRFVLAARVVQTESLAAAVHTFRHAAALWGLPDQFYADRGSCYDADLFRIGLAVLGVRRIGTRARNPQAHGKIEAYHRALHRWFVAELKHQLVRDLAHLQELLDAVIQTLYQPHPHRELGRSPKDALAGRLSTRFVSLERLTEAFLEKRSCALCPRTATVKLGRMLFRVPSELRHHKKVTVLVDPEYPDTPLLRDGHGALVALIPSLARRPKSSAPQGAALEKALAPIGSLTPLLEHYRGRALPKAYPGFGLPEIYAAFSQAMGRLVPADEPEAGAVVEFLKTGPFEPQVFHAALNRTLRQLGPGRPLSLILKHLSGQIVPPPLSKEKPS